MPRKITVADLFCDAGGTLTGLRQACDMLFRHTWHRHMGLMYALGQGAYCPSAGVMRSLQREGLITWTGPFRRPFGRPEMERPEQDRGWQITDAGRALLSLWAYCGGSDDNLLMIGELSIAGPRKRKPQDIVVNPATYTT